MCLATIDGLQPAIGYGFLTNADARNLALDATHAIPGSNEDNMRKDWD